MVPGTSYLVFRLITDKHYIGVMIVQILPNQHDVTLYILGPAP